MIGLAPLLTALREAGLPVGVAEMARLREVFARSAGAGGLRLESVLRAVLVKSPEERAVFERVFATWIGQAEHEVRLREEDLRDRPPPTPVLPARRVLRLRLLLSSAALVSLILLSLSLGVHVKVVSREAERSASQGQAGGGPQTPIAPPPGPIKVQTITVLVPVLTESPGPWPGWWPIGLAVTALAASAGLWRALRGRSWFPEPAPEPVRKGPPRVFLSPPEAIGFQLLASREEEALVWGIGHFVSDEVTRRLDLPATVRATARAGGVPHLLFHQARYPREVWLWIDEAADDPEIPRLADEVATALSAHGLPVERALFRGIPDRLVQPDGQVFAPNEVDERRDAALVAILTDGRVLARHYAADDRRRGLDTLLRGLSFWPRLAFVDFSAEPGELAAMLAPHFIERIAPMGLAGFLGADEALRRRALVVAEDVRVWAAACALAPSPVAEAQAFELRRRLRLEVAPWALRNLRAEAPGPAGRLRWAPPLRAQRINWLRTAEAQGSTEDEAGLDPATQLGQALTFWEGVYDREFEERTRGEEGALWQKTPAHQHLRMERALLALWNQESAPGAIRDLHSLHDGALRETIEEHLGQMTPRDRGDGQGLELPWSWAARTGAEQAMLLDMRLGGGMPQVALRRPGRLWLGLALCLGLGSGALAGAFLRQPAGPPGLVHGPGKPADAHEEVRQIAPGAWRVTVASGTETATREVQPGARVAVRWVEEARSTCRTGETETDQGVVFVRICPGSFIMGSSAEARLSYGDEEPAHQVTLSEYWIGRTEVTGRQFGGPRGGSDLPVTRVSWLEAESFCRQRGWRLPTEAEWENAARAGTTTAWSSGDDEKELGEFAWFEGNSRFEPHPVGTKAANPWGLYDMHGNVWEWVGDWYEPYQAGSQDDPVGPSAGDRRVLRGGAFNISPRNLRSAVRGRVLPEDRFRDVGFRCARGPRRQALTP